MHDSRSQSMNSRPGGAEPLCGHRLPRPVRLPGSCPNSPRPRLPASGSRRYPRPGPGLRRGSHCDLCRSARASGGGGDRRHAFGDAPHQSRTVHRGHRRIARRPSELRAFDRVRVLVECLRDEPKRVACQQRGGCGRDRDHGHCLRHRHRCGARRRACRRRDGGGPVGHSGHEPRRVDVCYSGVVARPGHGNPGHDPALLIAHLRRQSRRLLEHREHHVPGRHDHGSCHGRDRGSRLGCRSIPAGQTQGENRKEPQNPAPIGDHAVPPSRPDVPSCQRPVVVPTTLPLTPQPPPSDTLPPAL